MKNPTILKDELGLLRADRSAVLIELRTLGDELKEIHTEIGKAEKILADVKNNTLKETARRDDIRTRAVLLRKEEGDLKQEINTLTAKTEAARTKNSQEINLHLGRIKELRNQEEELLSRIEELKRTFDKNMTAMNSNLSETTAKYKAVDSALNDKVNELNKATEELGVIKEEEKKITKDRLKREDKIRARERGLTMAERGLAKREEDLMTMASDLTVVYFRLKELYAKVDPSVDIDRLITKAK